MTGAATAREAFEQLDEAMELWLEVAILDGDAIPGPARALMPVA